MKVFILSLFAGSVAAQDTLARREIWLGVQSLVHLQLMPGFKYRIAPKSFLRGTFTDLYFNRNMESSSESGSGSARGSGYGGGVLVGFEFRHAINGRLAFYHGPGLSATYRYTENLLENSFGFNFAKQYEHSYGLDYTTGLLLNLKRSWIVAVQINPSLYVVQRRTENSGPLQSFTFYYEALEFRLSRYAPLLALAYRF